jgi:hypothetical protein
LVPSAFDEIKAAEDLRIRAMEDKYEQEMKAMHEQMNKIMSLIQQNPTLAHVKPDVFTRKMDRN